MQKHFPKLFILLLLVCNQFDSTAQSQTNTRIPDKYWSIDLSAGLAIMPIKTSSPLLGKRPTLGFLQGFTLNYAFSPNWLVYGGFGFNYYYVKHPAILDPASIGLQAQDIIDDIFGPLESIKPTIYTGIQYRFKYKNWEILPKLGFSYTVDDWERDRQLTIKDNGVHLHYTMNATVPAFQVGVNGHYWVGKGGKGYLLFGVSTETPFQKPNATATYLRGDEIMKTNSVKSAAYGQNIYVQFGYGFAFGRRYGAF